MKLFNSGFSQGKSISNEIQRIIKGLSPFLSENIINEILPKIASLILQSKK